LFLPLHLAIQRPKAEVTVRYKRAHSEFLSESERLAVAGFSQFELGRLATPGKRSEPARLVLWR
jgi:hypothetical protein